MPMLLDKDWEWTIGFSNAELIGDLDNSNVSEVVGFT